MDFRVAVAVSRLVFAVQPSHAGAGSVITPVVQVTAQDALGTTVTSFTDSVRVALGTNPVGGSLLGTTTQAAVSGVASFRDLSIAKAGTGYRLTAWSGAVAGDTSNVFNITAGRALKLAFTVQPGTTHAGDPIPAIHHRGPGWQDASIPRVELPRRTGGVAAVERVLEATVGLVDHAPHRCDILHECIRHVASLKSLLGVMGATCGLLLLLAARE